MHRRSIIKRKRQVKTGISILHSAIFRRNAHIVLDIILVVCIGGHDGHQPDTVEPHIRDIIESQALRAEFETIMKFWLDKGAGGFRLDAVKEFYSGATGKNVEVLTWVN